MTKPTTYHSPAASEYAPVGVRMGRCRCAGCMAAFRAAYDAQRPPVEAPSLLEPSVQPTRRGRRDPRARAALILAQEAEALGWRT